MINWEPLTANKEVRDIENQSFDQPVMIFKHSTRCGISFSALDGLINEWDASKVEKLGSTYMLDVISERDYAREIGSYFGIPHQSPQVLVINEGKCVYDQSHFRINFRELEELVDKLND